MTAKKMLEQYVYCFFGDEIPKHTGGRCRMRDASEDATWNIRYPLTSQPAWTTLAYRPDVTILNLDQRSGGGNVMMRCHWQQTQAIEIELTGIVRHLGRDSITSTCEYVRGSRPSQGGERELTIAVAR